MSKIYPSSSAFMIGDLIHTDSQGGCLRNILMADHGVRDDSISDVNIRVGAAHEAYYARNLSDEVFGAETPVKGDVNGIPYSGRADFVTKFNGLYVPHETKATVSYNTYRKVIKDGQVKSNNLSQLVFYMTHFNTPYGKLIYGYYKDLDGYLFELKEMRTFKVVIDESGNIMIDGQHSGYMVQEHMAHRIAVAEMLKSQTVEERPQGCQSGEGACKWCVFKQTCLRWDTGLLTTTEEFIEDGRKECGKTNSGRRDKDE